MSEAPESPHERIWANKWRMTTRNPQMLEMMDGEPVAEYVLASRYEEALRQRDVAVEALKAASDMAELHEWFLHDEGSETLAAHAAIHDALAACSTPPLARGDVKTGKVVRDG